MRPNFAEFRERVDRVVNSDLFIAFEALLVLIGWSFDIWAIMLPILFAINTLPLFLGKSLTHLLGLLMMMTLVISSNRHALSSFTPILITVPVLIVGVIFNVIASRRDLFRLRPNNVKGFHCSLIALIIPAAFAGVTAPVTNAVARVAALALFIVFAAVYTLFVASTKTKENKGRLMEYLLKVLFLMGLVIACEMLIFFIRIGSAEGVLNAITKKAIDLGWAGPNNAAPMLSMCVPATLYFCIKRNKLTPVFAVIALAEYALIIMTGCRGAILFTTIAMPFMLFFVITKSQNKLAFALTVSICFGVAVALIIYFGKYSSEVLTSILNKGLNSSGRVEGLYPEAIEVFKRDPIFGGGWDYRLGELAHDGYSPYWFHSTALQVLATMGIVGVIAYAFFYFFRYRTFLAMRKNPAAIALMAGVLLFDLYGMVDTNFFGPTFFIMLLCMTFVVEINLPDNKCRAFAGKDPFLAAAKGVKRLFIRAKLKTHANKSEYVGYYQNSLDEQEVSDREVKGRLGQLLKRKRAERHNAESGELVTPAEASSDEWARADIEQERKTEELSYPNKVQEAAEGAKNSDGKDKTVYDTIEDEAFGRGEDGEAPSENE